MKHIEINRPEYIIQTKGKDFEDCFANASIWYINDQGVEVEGELTEEHYELIRMEVLEGEGVYNE